MQLEHEVTQTNFWDDTQSAANTLRQLDQLRSIRDDWNDTQQKVSNLTELAEIAITDQDQQLISDIKVESAKLATWLDQTIIQLALTGEHDLQPAMITIQAGTGGTEAQYWAETLLGMYCRWAAHENRPNELLNVSYGEKAGIKQATLLIEGDHPYGILQGEAGVHRLSRISTFDPSRRRHTSFARVELMPDLPPSIGNIRIDKSEVRTDTFRASGPGGQHVQKSDTAVRLTHLPTGIKAIAQSERSQKQNLEAATRILTARLNARHTKEQELQARELRGNLPAAQWSNQIRSYILNPNQLVADHRTGVKLQNAKSVLDGNLEPLIQAFIDHRLKSA